jgi:hypothetical protein
MMMAMEMTVAVVAVVVRGRRSPVG